MSPEELSVKWNGAWVNSSRKSDSAIIYSTLCASSSEKRRRAVLIQGGHGTNNKTTKVFENPSTGGVDIGAAYAHSAMRLYNHLTHLRTYNPNKGEPKDSPGSLLAKPGSTCNEPLQSLPCRSLANSDSCILNLGIFLS